MRAHRAGLRIIEEPISFGVRMQGESKLSSGVVVEGAKLLVTLRRDPWSPERPRRVTDPATPARRLRAFASRWYRPLAAIATAAGVTLALVSQREAISQFDWHLDPVVLALAVLGFATTSLVQGVAFYCVLRGLGRRPQFAALPGRVDARRSSPATRPAARSRSSCGCASRSGSTPTARSSCRPAATSSSSPWRAGRSSRWAGSSSPRPTCPGSPTCCACAAVVGIAVAAPRIGGRRIAALVERRFGVKVTLLRGRVLVAICLLNAAGWLATGAGAWLLVDAITGDAPSFAWMLSVYALGVMVGFVLPILPAGLGLREGVTVSLLAPRYGVGAATTMTLALRLVATGGELAAIGIGELIGLAVRRPRSA